jgi:DNA primase large subunit
MSFFEFIQKGVSLFNIVFAMIIFYATISFSESVGIEAWGGQFDDSSMGMAVSEGWC